MSEIAMAIYALPVVGLAYTLGYVLGKTKKMTKGDEIEKIVKYAINEVLNNRIPVLVPSDDKRKIHQGTTETLPENFLEQMKEKMIKKDEDEAKERKKRPSYVG